jgi:SAM-dependent methyltransferase
LRRFSRYRASGRLLELGCAYGFFLSEAQRTFEAQGIEISTDAVAYCRSQGLNVEQGELTKDFIHKHARFDAAVMLDVIEHLPDPEQTLRRLHQLLTPGGHIIITTGDWDSLLSRAMGASWRLMTPPQHLFFFSRKTLRMLLERIGFEVLEIRRPWKIVPMSLIAYQLQRIVGLSPKRSTALPNIGIPVNLFDAVSVIARKR